MVKRRWRDEELALMARTEARLLEETGRCTNVDLLKSLSGSERTLEAIKGKRRCGAYKSLVQACRAEYQAPQTSSQASESRGSARPESESVESADQPLPAEDAPPVADDPSPHLAGVPDNSCADQIVAELLERAAVRRSRHGLGSRSARRHRNSNVTRADTALAGMSSRKRRRIEYARVQELFKKCRSRAAAEVIDGVHRSVRHSLEDMEAYWRPILERVSDAPGPTPSALNVLRREEQYGGARDYSRLWAPFTTDEVKASKFDWQTAPGPDGIRPDEWRTVPAARKAEIFNSWLTTGVIPEPLRQCRTIFVPKTDDPAGPGDYRPISIASIPLRHMHSVLARRLLACCPPDARQRGFVRADGTLENSAVLDAVLGDSRKKLRECHVAVLDFAKAFDTVSHRALVELLRARGLPAAFCDYVHRLYDSATTTLDVGGQSSEPAKVGRGVRQGDPLSPILFNMAMDVILASLPKEVGYRLEMERVSALAYADDLVLLAGSKVGMQESIDRVFEVASSMGLSVNNNKSSVLSMVPDGKRKKHHYLTGKNFRIGRKWLPQTSCVERWRYLGIDFQASGCVTLEHDVKIALNNITKAPLKPQQRLEIVRGHLIPRFLHGLVLGNISDDRLCMLDVQIRGAVRNWLRLPKDVPVGYFHADIKDGGLAIPSLRATVPDLILKRFGRLDSSSWPVAKAAARSERIRKKLSWAGRQFGKFTREDPVTGLRSVSRFWRERLWSSVDGFELRESARTPASTKWIREESSHVSGRDFVQFVHTHINALPSRVRTSRGRRIGREAELNCRAGCVVRETTAHTIQQCWRTHGGRIMRHDRVVGLVAEAMASDQWSVVMEPHVKTSKGLRKPDIVAAKGGVGVIVDVQVVSGQRPLDDAHREKRSKYGTHEELVEKVAGILGLPNKDCVHATSCTISWRGVWSHSSYKELKRLLGLKESLFRAIPVVVLRGSHMNWTRFSQMTGAAAGGPE